MSYILDALKRAEHERSGALGTAPTREAASAGLNRLSPALLIGIGALLFAAGIGLSWLLLRPDAANEAVAPGAPALATAPASTPAPLPTPSPSALPSAPPAVAAASAASAQAAAEVLTPEGDAQDGELLADAAEIEPALAGYESLDDLTPVFQGIGAGAGTATAKPAGVSGAASAGRTRPEFVPAPATAAPTHLEPLLRDMPQGYRDQFPNLTVQVHVHNAAPAKRWIMVDGKRYNEGSQLDSGPQIVEIAADGIVFAFRNERVFWPLTR
ncbi:MAG TPA: general secretion pathway protein GspB [Fontimonas sp.]